MASSTPGLGLGLFGGSSIIFPLLEPFLLKGKKLLKEKVGDIDAKIDGAVAKAGDMAKNFAHKKD